MPTRTIFFQISTAQQLLFYALAILALATCFHGFWRRCRLWRIGRPTPRVKDWPARVRRVAEQVLAQRRVRRRRYAGRMHTLLFYGMAALFTGTCIVAVEHYGALLFGDHWLYRGWFYLACKLLLDLFGLALLVSLGMALARRYGFRPRSLGQDWKDGGFLLLLFAATLTGFLLEGAGIAADPARQPWAGWSPVGGLVSLPLRAAGASGVLSASAYVALWWLHMPLVLGVIAALPYGRWLHLFVIPATVAFQPDRPMGALERVRMEEVEQTGRIGLGAMPDLTRWELMSLDGCMECGRCTDVCPAQAAGKQLDPKEVALDLRRVLTKVESDGGRADSGPRAGAEANRGSGTGGAPLDSRPSNQGNQGSGTGGESLDSRFSTLGSTDVISDESLWACTNCHACVRECPALIRHVDLLDGIRRYRVAEGRLSGAAAVMLRQLGSRENPWGLPSAQRLDWAKGLDIPAAAKDDGRETLLWVGCAGAFEPRGQKSIRALAELMQAAGVRFSVLGPRERCTGDPARRMGDEFLFQQLAESNIATLQEVGAKRIVTQCPHCFHTMKNEYPQLGGDLEVMHHTQFLAGLAAEGRLTLNARFAGKVTYHDPCFLARVNGETRAPRALFGEALAEPLAEPARRKCKTFCCGAGGGRMWMEEPPEQRPGIVRAKELLATGASTVAVGCPFCKVMVSDSLNQTAGESAPPVMDVSELLLAALAQRENPRPESAGSA